MSILLFHTACPARYSVLRRLGVLSGGNIQVKYFANAKREIICIEINSVFEGCNIMMSSNKGCVECKDGYYKKSNGLECE